MVLTGGQTYFLFFCVTCVAITVVKGVVDLIRVHKMTSPCSELRKVQEEVKLIRTALRRASQNARRSA